MDDTSRVALAATARARDATAARGSMRKLERSESDATTSRAMPRPLAAKGRDAITIRRRKCRARGRD